MDYIVIDHKKGVPYWPQSNGEVERYNETLMKTIRIAQLEGNDWRKAVENFLFQYRTTPHATTGKSPSELPMGKRLRDKLPGVKIRDSAATEPDPYHVVHREGNAVTIASADGRTKMRNAGHMKMFVQPEVDNIPRDQPRLTPPIEYPSNAIAAENQMPDPLIPSPVPSPSDSVPIRHRLV